MAVTSIWGIKGRFDRLINYAVNPEKTVKENPDALQNLHSIDDLILYTTDEIKTEKCLYVTGIKCNPETAAEDFKNTKKHWGKTGGIVAFHGIQSFAKGEVDPKTANEIGVELAKRLWGDRFEVVVATHSNTSHIHNHFCINSVSIMDGNKYNDCKETYRRMREESDRLCKEYDLSVIEHPKDKGMSYAEWRAEKNGQPTVRGAIREAIDIAERGSMTESEFLDAMEQMGFVIDRKGKYPKIKHNGDERFVRFKSLGEGYDYDEIIDRVYHNDYPEYPDYAEQESPQQIFSDYPGKKVSAFGYTAVYHCYCKALIIATERPETNKRIYALVRQDTTKMQSYSDQNRLLSEHHIETPEQLMSYKAEAMKLIDETVDKRREMRNALKRAERSGDGVLISQIKFNIDLYSRQLKKLRREVVCCDGVMERVEVVREKLYRIENEKFRGMEESPKMKTDRNQREDTSGYNYAKA